MQTSSAARTLSIASSCCRNSPVRYAWRSYMSNGIPVSPTTHGRSPRYALALCWMSRIPFSRPHCAFLYPNCTLSPSYANQPRYFFMSREIPSYQWSAHTILRAAASSASLENKSVCAGVVGSRPYTSDTAPSATTVPPGSPQSSGGLPWIVVGRLKMATSMSACQPVTAES